MLWDDMLRSAPMDVLNKFEYGLIRDHVELVVWQYSTKPSEHLPSDLLVRYRSSFRNGLWAATAFKGKAKSGSHISLGFSGFIFWDFRIFLNFYGFSQTSLSIFRIFKYFPFFLGFSEFFRIFYGYF